MKSWLNKHWTHERDDEGDFGFRAALHIPMGMVLAVPFIGETLVRIFCKYEESEDAHTKDEAWKDYYGVMAGYIPTRLAILAGTVWVLVKVLLFTLEVLDA